MSAVFYPVFERHAHGEGLKGRSTHYCPGCGHGLVHKYLASAIEELGIQDRAVAISPVGCSVFLHYYLDVGNTQAAHGRAPAVALGQKLANPRSIVIAYQGDGDLASIGLAEILQAAQMGVPLTVVFVNNAVYGMTGGQMAPTTLPGQRTTTTPLGRGRLEGAPLRMAEMIAQLDGPVYVERVALYDARQRVRARKAIKKAVRLQVEDRGFALVEVLAECPVHLHLTPREAQAWVRDLMVPAFPLGVKKDVAAEKWELPTPVFEAAALARTVGAATEAPPRYCRAFPRHLFGREIAIKVAGTGGDGAQTAALLLARAAIDEGFDATHIPSYGPESRGGTSYADVRIAEDEVLSPPCPRPNVLVAFNGPSLAKFGPEVAPGGVIVYDRSVIATPPRLDPSIRLVGADCAATAAALGKPQTKNVVALGALQAATGLFPVDTFREVIRQVLKDKPELAAVNESALGWGVRGERPVS
jgi:2-oxoisovalerate ferredoxin oxidoreductase beta subunit